MGDVADDAELFRGRVCTGPGWFGTWSVSLRTMPVAVPLSSNDDSFGSTGAVFERDRGPGGRDGDASRFVGPPSEVRMEETLFTLDSS